MAAPFRSPTSPVKSTLLSGLYYPAGFPFWVLLLTSARVSSHRWASSPLMVSKHHKWWTNLLSRILPEVPSNVAWPRETLKLLWLDLTQKSLREGQSMGLWNLSWGHSNNFGRNYWKLSHEIMQILFLWDCVFPTLYCAYGAVWQSVSQGSEQVSPNMPLWHEDYFELKAIETQQIQKKLFPSPLNCPILRWKEHLQQEDSYYQRFLFTYGLLACQDNLCFQTSPLPPCEWPFLPTLSPDPPILFLSSGCYISLSGLAAFCGSYLYGAPVRS